MPYPTRPTGPRDSWVPDPDCEAAKAALVRQYNEAEARAQQRYDLLAHLCDDVCRDALRLRQGGTANNSEECISSMERLCELLRFLEMGWAKRLYAAELGIMAAIDGIDCFSTEWRVRFDAAVLLWQDYGSLTNLLFSDFQRFKAWWDEITHKCPNFYPTVPPPAPPGAPTFTPWYDSWGGWLAGGGGGGNVTAPAPCGCGNTP